MASASLRSHRAGERKQRGPNFNAERVGGLSSSTNSYGSNEMVSCRWPWQLLHPRTEAAEFAYSEHFSFRL